METEPLQMQYNNIVNTANRAKGYILQSSHQDPEHLGGHSHTSGA